ncbi:MAG: hypothetical protein Q4Q23_07000 [Methanobacteriaceae archaeon]|nr:hypothetical protein [Methanobacteriaceae archaeon]
MKMVSFGADISCNDISCSDTLISNVTSDVNLLSKEVIYAGVTNITGDDLVISAVINDNQLEDVNSKIIKILKDNAENFGDLNGIGLSPENAGEGVSYAEIELNEDYYPDAIVIGFDTYAGESFVGDVASSAMKAALGMDFVGEISGGCVENILEIPGVGFVSKDTDDPVVIVSIENIEHVGIVAGAMIGSILGNKNTYFVKRGTPTNVIPGSVIFSVSAFLNGNIIDLAEPFNQRMNILPK